ncbi:MAG: glycosyltransferase [Bacteroidaceae bacterium]|nr:glycosyltransferase [Bacteroidaceae bacterium]
MPKISVILPVYNAEQYLDVCLNSIVSQSFSDWECICVNDGSTDGSAAILQQYVEQDDRIRVIAQDNQGLASARSVAMAQARGTYIVFVDADDFLDEDALEHLYQISENQQVEVLGFSYKTYPQGQSSHYTMQTGTVLSPSQLLASTTQPQSSDDLCFVWRYMIRRDFLQKYNICFNTNVRFAEDMIFMMEVFAHAQRVYLSDDAPYHYRIDNPHSIMRERRYNPYMEESLSMGYAVKRKLIADNSWDNLTPFSLDVAERAVKSYSRMLMLNRKANGEPKEKYIREVLLLPMIQDAMKVVGFRNIFDNWKEYFVYLCMKCCFMPVLKRYF